MCNVAEENPDISAKKTVIPKQRNETEDNPGKSEKSSLISTVIDAMEANPGQSRRRVRGPPCKNKFDEIVTNLFTKRSRRSKIVKRNRERCDKLGKYNAHDVGS